MATMALTLPKRGGRGRRQLTRPKYLHASGEEHGFGLLFTNKGGPLVAVAGLCGGAGATMFATILASAAATESRERVLLCDLGGPTASIGAYAGVVSGLSPVEAALCLARKVRPTGQVFAEGHAGMRILASRPSPDGSSTDAKRMEMLQHGMSRLLEQGRRNHALTVVDCGTLQRAVEISCVQAAQYVIWVVPATQIAARRGRALLHSLDFEVEGKEIIVARADLSTDKPPHDALEALAYDRNAPLVLMPQVPDPTTVAIEESIEASGQTLLALGGILNRSQSTWVEP